MTKADPSQRKLNRVRIGDQVRILQPNTGMARGLLWSDLGTYIGRKILGIRGPRMPAFRRGSSTIYLDPKAKVYSVEIVVRRGSRS
jgi:hypothetical protein